MIPGIFQISSVFVAKVEFDPSLGGSSHTGRLHPPTLADCGRSVSDDLAPARTPDSGTIAPLCAQEVSLLKGLSAHPNLIAYRQSFMEEPGQLFIVMSLADGGDLRCVVTECLSQSSTLPEPVVLSWVRQTLCGLRWVRLGWSLEGPCARSMPDDFRPTPNGCKITPPPDQACLETGSPRDSVYNTGGVGGTPSFQAFRIFGAEGARECRSDVSLGAPMSARCHGRRPHLATIEAPSVDIAFRICIRGLLSILGG